MTGPAAAGGLLRKKGRNCLVRETGLVHGFSSHSEAEAWGAGCSDKTAMAGTWGLARVLSSENGAPLALQAPSFCKQCCRDVDGQSPRLTWAGHSHPDESGLPSREGLRGEGGCKADPGRSQTFSEAFALPGTAFQRPPPGGRCSAGSGKGPTLTSSSALRPRNRPPVWVALIGLCNRPWF